MPLVMTCGVWRDLLPEPDVYRCRTCGGMVSLGNDGHAVSLPKNENGIYQWEYVHYAGECKPEAAPTAAKRKNRKVKHGK